MSGVQFDVATRSSAYKTLPCGSTCLLRQLYICSQTVKPFVHDVKIFISFGCTYLFFEFLIDSP